jgi:hypothetical protein
MTARSDAAHGGAKSFKSLPRQLGFRSPEGTIVRPPVHGGVKSSYTDAIARKICAQIADGTSLKKICSNPRMPSLSSIKKWLLQPGFEAFREMYYYSRRVAAELLMDEVIEIADDSADDWIETFDKNGKANGWKPDHEAIQRSRLKIDTRKWLASKLIPRIYGEKLEVEHGVTGDLARLLESATNNDSGLPPPIEGKVINEKG